MGHQINVQRYRIARNVKKLTSMKFRNKALVLGFVLFVNIFIQFFLHNQAGLATELAFLIKKIKSTEADLELQRLEGAAKQANTSSEMQALNSTLTQLDDKFEDETKKLDQVNKELNKQSSVNEKQDQNITNLAALMKTLIAEHRHTRAEIEKMKEQYSAENKKMKEQYSAKIEMLKEQIRHLEREIDNINSRTTSILGYVSSRLATFNIFGSRK